MVDLISQRLISIRKHLSDRLEATLSTQDVAERCELKSEQVYRLEHDLKGSTQSLVLLLMFYRSHGYNLDWILTADNTNIAMMITPTAQLQAIGAELSELSDLLRTRFVSLDDKLRAFGYHRTENTVFATPGLAPDPVGLTL